MDLVHTLLELILICFILFPKTAVVTCTGRINLRRYENRRLTDRRDTTGFISIDCGTSTSYTDESTTLYYAPDEDYIDTGENSDISPHFKSSTLLQVLNNVRSFPEGTKNCYTLRPTAGKGTNYLIRAYFMYGNYDFIDKPPTFDLLLGVDVWDTVQLDNSSQILVKEIIHTPSTDYLYVCLANTGSGTPFISGLELRHLNNSIYKTDFGSLVLHIRYYTSMGLSSIRYKDDVYDRIWQPAYWPSGSVIQTTSEIGSSFDVYSLPSSAMKGAMVPKQLSQPIQFFVPGTDGSTDLYTYFHVAEFSKLSDGEIREFNVTVNDQKFGPYQPLYLEADTIYSTRPYTGSSSLNISFQRTNRSTLPPVLNALEIYSLKILSQLSTDEADVRATKNIKSSYERMNDWQGDPCIPKVYSWPGVKCSYDSSPRIISLNLSSKGLTGHIAASFADFTSLLSLDLSNNSLTGQIPEFFADLPSLVTLNLARNNFTGSVPELLLEKSAAGSLSLSVKNNPGLCSSTSCISKKKPKSLLAYIAAFVTLFVLILAGFIVFGIVKKKSASGYGRPSPHSKGQSMITRFAYSEVTFMTKGFQRELGRGGFGVVYYGCLNDGTEVAVKMLSQAIDASEQFRVEIELLMAIRHRNLVSLVGYCEEGNTLALVYEYMAGGNLNHLLASGTLSWKTRLNIAIDAAQGLEYLHNGCRPPIVHRDVKTPNILLNQSLQAKIADFGMSKIFPDESRSHVLTRVIGTPGYLDPEYQVTDQLNEKSDVYSFGVVLWELITGQDVMVRRGGRTSSLVQRIVPILERGDLRYILDERLQGIQSPNSVWRVIDIAMACVKPTAIERPTMSQIVTVLKESLAMVMETENATRTPDESIEMSLVTSSLNMDPEAR